MPTSFMIFILVILKSFGGQLMCLKRHFSKALDTGKVKRKSYRNFNYCVPALSEERKQSIKKIVSIQMSGSYVSYTSLLRDGNVLVDMKTINMPEDMHKFHLNDVYNNVTEIIKNLPESDIYVVENYVKMPNNMNVVGANLFYVKLQTLAMLMALLNGSRPEDLSSNTHEPTNKVVLLKARLHARLFGIIVGTEVISSQDITELMLKGTFPDYVTPFVPKIDAILSYNSAEEPIVKELMSNGLMLAMTFVDLVLNLNQKSIEALSENSRRRLRKNNEMNKLNVL